MENNTRLPIIVKKVTQEQVHRYAAASADFNPIHVDPQFAAASSFGRPVAHGMLVLAFLSEMMTQAFGEAWLTTGKLKVRLKAPVFPEAIVETFGELRSEERQEKTRELRYAVGCRVQTGEEVIVGEARVTLSDTV